jgi:hypothetical protein
MAKRSTTVELDVHKESIEVMVAEPGRRGGHFGTIGGDLASVDRMAKEPRAASAQGAAAAPRIPLRRACGVDVPLPAVALQPVPDGRAADRVSGVHRHDRRSGASGRAADRADPRAAARVETGAGGGPQVRRGIRNIHDSFQVPRTIVPVCFSNSFTVAKTSSFAYPVT